MAEEGEEPYGLAGLANIGNTCYANSVLQALRVIPSWSALMEKTHDFDDDVDGTAKKIFLAYQDIARTLWSKEAVKGAICRPMAFWRDVREAVVGTVYENFRQNFPQDAHEFLTYILDQCHMALKQPVGDVDVDVDRRLHAQLGNVTSPVVDSLFGWDKVECICGACGAISTRYEPFNTLKVGLDNTVEDLVDLAAMDRLDEEIEDYACEACSPKRTTATLRRSLWRIPKTLIYMMRRFTADGRKDSMTINYDGSPICFDRIMSPDAERNGVTYRPIAIIDHMGSLHGGHYCAQVYHPVLKEWYVFDDERGERLSGPRFGPLSYIIVMSAE
jgi:ubiquitin C-terminal hydrolase